MWYRFTVRRNDLTAEVYNRQTVADTRAFFEALVAYANKHWCTRVLIHIYASTTLFRAGECGIVDYLEQLSAKPSCQVALFGDTEELCLSHEYIELLARQRGIDLRCFRDEFSALCWLARSTGPAPDERTRISGADPDAMEEAFAETAGGAPWD